MGTSENNNFTPLLLFVVADGKVWVALLDDERIGVLGFDTSLADIGGDLEEARIEFARHFDMHRAVGNLGYNHDGCEIGIDLNVNFSDEGGNLDLLRINGALNLAIKGAEARLGSPNTPEVDGAVEGLERDVLKVDIGHRMGNDIHITTPDEGFEGFKVGGEGDVDGQLDAF